MQSPDDKPQESNSTTLNAESFFAPIGESCYLPKGYTEGNGTITFSTPKYTYTVRMPGLTYSATDRPPNAFHRFMMKYLLGIEIEKC